MHSQIIAQNSPTDTNPDTIESDEIIQQKKRLRLATAELEVCSLKRELGELKPTRDFKWVSFNTLADDTTPTDWLIQDMVGSDYTWMLYGFTGSYKSFLALELGQCIARGIPWRDRPTKQGVVFYVAGEGYKGIRKRAAAYNNKHGKDESNNFYVSELGSNLFDKERLAELVASIKQMMGDKKAKLIIIDTLHANTAGANEDSSTDWGIIAGNIETELKPIADSVCFVHHTGKDPEKGDRGTSSRMAGVDGAFMLKRAEGSDIAIMTAKKIKDGEVDWKLGFKALKVEVSEHLNFKGENETSLVLEETEITVTEEKSVRTAVQKRADMLQQKYNLLIKNNPELREVIPTEIKTRHHTKGSYGIQIGSEAWEQLSVNFLGSLNSDNEDTKKRFFRNARATLIQEGGFILDNGWFFNPKYTDEMW